MILLFLATTGTTLGELGPRNRALVFSKGGPGVPRLGRFDVCDDRQFQRSRVGWLMFGMNEVILMKAMCMRVFIHQMRFHDR